MSYTRVIPRDLFNEASLLKMLGTLWIATEGYDAVSLELIDGGLQGFRIRQDEGDGSIYVHNIRLTIRGKPHHLYRPLNSRENWPLWIRDPTDPDFEDFRVFTDMGDSEGELSEEMLALIEDVAAQL